MRQRRIRGDRLELERRIRVEHFLLGLDDDLVLEESFQNTIVQRVLDELDILLLVMHVHPEKMRRAIGLGRHRLEITEFNYALAVTLPKAATGWREAGLEIKKCGH